MDNTISMTNKSSNILYYLKKNKNRDCDIVIGSNDSYFNVWKNCSLYNESESYLIP